MCNFVNLPTSDFDLFITHSVTLTKSLAIYCIHGINLQFSIRGPIILVSLKLLGLDTYA